MPLRPGGVRGIRGATATKGDFVRGSGNRGTQVDGVLSGLSWRLMRLVLARRPLRTMWRGRPHLLLVPGGVGSVKNMTTTKRLSITPDCISRSGRMV